MQWGAQRNLRAESLLGWDGGWRGLANRAGSRELVTTSSAEGMALWARTDQGLSWRKKNPVRALVSLANRGKEILWQVG